METDRDLFLISLFTFLTVSAWIFFELVKTTRTITTPQTVAQIVAPLSPTIDSGVLTQIAARTVY